MCKNDDHYDIEERFEVSLLELDDYLEGHRNKVNPKTLDQLDRLFKDFKFEEIRIFRMSASRIIFYPQAEHELRERESSDPTLRYYRELQKQEYERLNLQKRDTRR
ncbi:MAG: hypothetical protein AABY27_01820 [Pseudomonadota bacterium]